MSNGEWKCPKCRFHLSKRLLRASDGAVGINTEEVREVCPNDGATLIPDDDPESPEDILARAQADYDNTADAEEAERLADMTERIMEALERSDLRIHRRGDA